MVGRSRFVRLVVLVGATLFLCAPVAPHAAPGQQKPPSVTAAKPHEADVQKKNPLAKLGEPWPDAAKMSDRRKEAENLRLFQSADPLAFTLSADFKTVNRDRDPNSKKRYPAVITVTEGGKANSTPVNLGNRGTFRLMARNCSFIPLRVEFPKQESKGSLFDGQDWLKLVTHCQSDREYEQYVLREYLVYRIFNLFTPRSYRARLAKATYVDTTSGKPISTRYAMFIENEDDVARRLEGRIATLPRALFRDLDADSLTTMMLLQYLVGNTDFSIYALHNVRLIQDRARVLRPVTFDFDLSGLVNTPYAIPDRKLGITSVRERIYRGPCRTPEELEPLLAQFRTKKADLLALYDSLPDLSADYRREVKAYVEDFCSISNRKNDVKREFVDTCGKNAGM
jgi:hypothetical protein